MNELWRTKRGFEVSCYNLLHSDERMTYNLIRKITGIHQRYLKEWYNKNKDKIKLEPSQQKEYRVIKRRAKRIALIDFLGGKCEYCGFNDWRALQLDHKLGGGHKEIKKFGHQEKMYSYYYNNPELAKEKLQVLCANCNWIKRHERGEGVSVKSVQ